MMLTVPRNFTYTCLYVDDVGGLATIDLNVESSISTTMNDHEMMKDIISDHSNKVVDLRGFSSFDTLDNFNFVTQKLKIKCKNPIIKFNHSFAPHYGSIGECISETFKQVLCNQIFESGNTCADAYCKATPIKDDTILNLMYITSNGFEIKRGNITHEFKDDRSDTCPSCVEGFERYKSILTKLRTNIIADQSTEYSISGEYISDLQGKTDDEITTKLYETFYSIIEMAKIKSIKFTSQ